MKPNVKPATTLPAAAAKLTKQNRAIMAHWNDEVRKLLEARGAKLVHEYSETVDSVIGYTMRRFELETPAGKLTIHPSGNWLACQFEHPVRAKVWLRTWMHSNLNPYSGKWNFYYFGHDFHQALDAVRGLLDGVTKAPDA
jgi:hypothetical protein